MAHSEAPLGVEGTSGSGIQRMPGLEGKRVLVTGGSSGIGKAAVLAFAASGATVCAAARRAERLDEVVAATPKGSTVYRVVLDLTSEDSCKAAVKEAVSLMGGLDVVVNSGGILVEGSDDKVFELWSRMMSLHATSVWVITQEAVPELKKGGRGAVVNLSSVVATIPTSLSSPQLVSYHAVKRAQDAVTQSLALQLAKEGVRVNGVHPGAIHTKGLENMAAHRGLSPEEWLSCLAKTHAMGRIGEPHEVANVIAFLASDLASFVTGALVPVDGGAQLTFTLGSIE